MSRASNLGAAQEWAPGRLDLYVGMSEIHCERNDVHAAAADLATSRELSERTGFPYNRQRWCVAMARRPGRVAWLAFESA